MNYGEAVTPRPFADMDCSVARALDVIGEKWSLLIIRDVYQGLRRFEEIQQRLGIARNILTERLTRLVDEGVLERLPYQSRPERYEYRLTEKGMDAYPVLVALLRWGDRWATDDEDGPPVLLTHRGCGQDVTPVLACPACGEEVGGREMDFHWLPGRPRTNGSAESPPAPTETAGSS
jgi:DNA-binding HxlR family transcriptional regulator